MVKNNQLYYIYSDYLGTPRTLTDTNNTVVWQWDNTDPFGSNLPSIQTVEFNFRLPGQYFDSESGLHYNYFRTYNPQTGKYISTDPIGLDGGTNTYGYVDGNPLSGIDPLGLDVNVQTNGNNININVPISITGKILDKFTPNGFKKGTNVAELIQTESTKVWNKGKWKYGNCNVNIKFQVMYNGNNMLNNLEIFEGDPDEASTIYDHGRTEDYLIHANYGKINLNSSGPTMDRQTQYAFVHEVGHLMGLKDQYENINGKSVAKFLWEGNIMGSLPGTVSQKNIDMIININVPKAQLIGCGC